ncbi:MAG: dimethylamine monooxygenase subunit [Actinomycetota bacterium]|nr:dimethylamine monooxygenase subunit [Actinomycetota bacterium]
MPANYYPTAEHAVKHLLIAGGIGVTPALSHRSHLKLQEERVELHYTFRNAESAAFVPFLTFQCDPNVHLYDGSQGQKLDIPALIRRQPEGTHVYTCGPPGLMDATVKAAEALGWPEESIHVERFGAGPVKGDEPFEAVCQLSGKTVQVGETGTLLDALEAAGIEIPFACRAGSCGSCEVDVVAGTIIHRDTVLSAAERAKGVTMLACVSRGKGALTLNV